VNDPFRVWHRTRESHDVHAGSAAIKNDGYDRRKPRFCGDECTGPAFVLQRSDTAKTVDLEEESIDELLALPAATLHFHGLSNGLFLPPNIGQFRGFNTIALAVTHPKCLNFARFVALFLRYDELVFPPSQRIDLDRKSRAIVFLVFESGGIGSCDLRGLCWHIHAANEQDECAGS